MHRRRARPEQAMHRAVVTHLQARGVAGLVYLHPANGGARSAIEEAILKSMGVVKGAPDLLLFHDNHSYALELKADSGRVSESQVACELDVIARDVAAEDRRFAPSALLDSWGLCLCICVRGRRADPLS